VVVLESNGVNPELGRLPLPRHVHMDRLATVAREEEPSVWTALKDRGAHSPTVPAFAAGGRDERAPGRSMRLEDWHLDDGIARWRARLGSLVAARTNAW
jgi:hypothetical protein